MDLTSVLHFSGRETGRAHGATAMEGGEQNFRHDPQRVHGLFAAGEEEEGEKGETGREEGENISEEPEGEEALASSADGEGE